jgi:hypothetical protein
MNTFESIAWIQLGFAPTLVAMEIGWKIVKKFKPKLQEVHTDEL